MRASQLRDLEIEDLYLRLGELKEELFNLRFQFATGQLDNHKAIKRLRRDVARVQTVLREHELRAFEEEEERLAAQREGAADDAEVAEQ